MNWGLMKFRPQDAFATWKRHHPPKAPPVKLDTCSRCGHEYQHHWEQHRDGCGVGAGAINVEEGGCFDQCMCKGWVSSKWLNQKLDEAISILKTESKVKAKAADHGLSLVEPDDRRGALSLPTGGELSLKK